MFRVLGDTGEAIGFLEFHKEVMKVLEADFLFMTVGFFQELPKKMLHHCSLVSGRPQNVIH